MSEEDSSVHGDGGESDETIRMRYDWDATSPSTAAVETVAKAAGSRPNEIEPLYSYVDPESLDALVSPKRETRVGTTDSVSFEYGTYDVTVRSSGEVSVRKDGAG